MRGVWIRSWGSKGPRVWDEATGPNTGWEQSKIKPSNARAREDARTQDGRDG